MCERAKSDAGLTCMEVWCSIGPQSARNARVPLAMKSEGEAGEGANCRRKKVGTG